MGPAGGLTLGSRDLTTLNAKDTTPRRLLEAHDPSTAAARGTAWRWGLVSIGIACVGLGAVGVVVPGLPTTIFLIIASWCFARSCPWLERKLIRNRFFAPFLKYLEPGARMPVRAMLLTLAIMWVAIGLSVWTILASEAPVFVAPTVIAAGVIGSWFVVRLTRR
ncbi:MAG: DUF454 family protein [Phycisphaerales bacterium]